MFDAFDNQHPLLTIACSQNITERIMTSYSFGHYLFTLSCSDLLSSFLAMDRKASSSSPSRFCRKPHWSNGWILKKKKKTQKVVLHMLYNTVFDCSCSYPPSEQMGRAVLERVESNIRNKNCGLSCRIILVDTDLDLDIVWTSRDSLSIASSTSLLITSSSTPHDSPSTNKDHSENQYVTELATMALWELKWSHEKTLPE